jgi:NPCBM/NEW2 domain-containing protein
MDTNIGSAQAQHNGAVVGILGVGVGVVGVIVALAAWLFPRSPGQDTPVPADTSGTAAAPNATARQVASPPSTTSTKPAVSPPSRPPVTYLADMTPITDSSDVDPGSVTIDGVDYDRSLRFTCEAFCNDGSTSLEVYYLGGKYKSFDVVVGVNDRAEEVQDGVFQVVLDKHAEDLIRVPQNSRRKIKIDVTGVHRLGLRAFRPGTVDNPAMAGANAAGGVSNRLPDLAWGNPKVSG